MEVRLELRLALGPRLLGARCNRAHRPAGTTKKRERSEAFCQGVMPFTWPAGGGGESQRVNKSALFSLCSLEL